MNGSTIINVPRADWTGPLSQFVSENAAFMPDYEMERIITALKADGHTTHKPVNSKEFGIYVANRDLAA